MKQSSGIYNSVAKIFFKLVQFDGIFSDYLEPSSFNTIISCWNKK